MKKTYLVAISIIAGTLILSACGKPEEIKVFGEGDAAPVVNYNQLNCEQSGGTFADALCTCADGYTYNEKSGLCANADGLPGGELGTK